LKEDVRVRALVRTPDAASLPAGVEVVRGDLTVPASIDDHLRGIDAVFLVWTAPATGASSVVARIAQAVPRTVFLSSPHQTPHPFFQQPNPLAMLHADIERTISRYAAEWTFLRPGMFAANARGWWGAQIRAGDVVRWPYADAPTAPIDERDIAAVAARSLLDAGHATKDYVITGPESLTQREQVTTIGDVIGRPLRFEELSPEAARREIPFPLPALNMLLNAWGAAIGQPALVTDTVTTITGTSARRFRVWANDNAAEFRV
jgi:uncharacterized protein YbjT (DUF2867 family)